MGQQCTCETSKGEADVTKILASATAACSQVSAADKDSKSMSNHRLLVACRDNDISALKLALDEGAFTETRRPFVMRPKPPTTVGSFLEGFDKKKRAPKEGLTPLMYMVQNGSLVGTQLLLQAQANVQARDEDHVTPLHLAASSGVLEVCQLLLQYGADITAQDDDGRIPMSYVPKDQLCTRQERLRWEKVLQPDPQAPPRGPNGTCRGGLAAPAWGRDEAAGPLVMSVDGGTLPVDDNNPRLPTAASMVLARMEGAEQPLGASGQDFANFDLAELCNGKTPSPITSMREDSALATTDATSNADAALLDFAAPNCEEVLEARGDDLALTAAVKLSATTDASPNDDALHLELAAPNCEGAIEEARKNDDLAFLTAAAVTKPSAGDAPNCEAIIEARKGDDLALLTAAADEKSSAGGDGGVACNDNSTSSRARAGAANAPDPVMTSCCSAEPEESRNTEDDLFPGASSTCPSSSDAAAIELIPVASPNSDAAAIEKACVDVFVEETTCRKDDETPPKDPFEDVMALLQPPMLLGQQQ